MASLPNPKQRRCLSSTSDATSTPVTCSLELDRSLQSALAMAMADPSIEIGLILEHILDSTPLQFDKYNLVGGVMNLASSLTEAVIRSGRKLATSHNSSVWFLPNDLTINLSLVCSSEIVHQILLCYADIDFTIRSVAKVTDPVVSTMIQ